MIRASIVALFILWCTAAVVAKDDATDQMRGDAKPIGGGKPVSTVRIKPCPDGYELVIRVDGRRGCAKDILPANE